MAVSIKSRYWNLPPLRVQGEEGSTVALPSRPRPPRPAAGLPQHLLTGVESLESLAWRFYGSSSAWWHIADANPLAFPLDYRPGTAVALPGGTGAGRVLRTRSF